MKLYFKVPPEADGMLLRGFLRKCSVSTDLSRAVKFRGSGFFADGAPILANRRVEAGQVISFELPPEGEGVAPQDDIPVDVVYEDAFALVVEKPPHLAVHPTLNYPLDTLANGYAAWALRQGRSPVFRPVNRIDKDTSGLLIVAKNDRAHQGLAEQIKVHSFTRVYEAIVYGKLRDDSGTVNAPIGRHPIKRKQMAVTPVNSKPAVTHYEVIARYDGNTRHGAFTHVRLRLETGRTHQIRVHMASIGHPVVGDAVYGPDAYQKELHGQCLHARTIGFVHPVTGAYLEFTSDLPPYFKDFLAYIAK